jgi:alpha-tubulin suppressor-like RCC1 family protein
MERARNQTPPKGPRTGGILRRRVAFVVATALFTAVSVTLVTGTTAGGSERSRVATASTVYRWGVVGNDGAITALELKRPTAVTDITGRVVQIATSNSDGYALTANGQVYGWGVNSYGELGDGRATPYETRAVRVDFPAGVKITALANPMPFDAAIAIDSTGRAWGWGLNGDSDLCLTGLDYSLPQEIPLTNVTLASGARTHALFDSNGTLYACGSGDAGELGNGSTASVSTPTAVTGLPSGAPITALTSSWEGSGALLANGDYFDWGFNAAGQLGDGATTDSAVPMEVTLPSPVVQVFQGGSGAANGQTIVILKDGSTWAWGDNDRGQLGIGTHLSSATPVKIHVPSGVSFVTVCSGGYASYAIDATGRLWAWGDDRQGQLGTAGGRPETIPVNVGIRLSQISSTAQDVAGLGA